MPIALHQEVRHAAYFACLGDFGACAAVALPALQVYIGESKPTWQGAVQRPNCP
jgi:hypothetical protein